MREAPPEVIEQLRTPWPSSQMVDLIQRMTWRVLETSGPIFFVTSDNPAFYFGAYGLGDQEAELSFPLCTSRVLHGCWQGDQGDLLFLNGSQGLVKEVNRRMASTTSRLAFYHSGQAPWIHQLLKKETPYLSRIRW